MWGVIWLIYQLFCFQQFPCVQAPILVWFCYVLPVSPKTDGCLTVRKNTDIATSVALFYILHYTSLNCIHLSLQYHGMKPRTEAVPLLKPHLHTPIPVRLLVLYPSVYQARFPLSSGLNLFCCFHLSGNMTVNGLWYTFFGSILSDPICRMGPCFISWERHNSNCNIMSIHCEVTENSCNRLAMAWPWPPNSAVPAMWYISYCMKLNECSAANVIWRSGGTQ